MRFRFTAHALEQIERRGIDRGSVEQVLEQPGQSVEQRPGRRALQSKVHFGGRKYLLRAIVDFRAEPPAAVTVYRTRHVAKYWRQE